MCYTILRGGLITWNDMMIDEGETFEQKWGTTMPLGSVTWAKPTPRCKVEVKTCGLHWAREWVVLWPPLIGQVIFKHDFQYIPVEILRYYFHWYYTDGKKTVQDENWSIYPCPCELSDKWEFCSLIDLLLKSTSKPRKCWCRSLSENSRQSVSSGGTAYTIFNIQIILSAK